MDYTPQGMQYYRSLTRKMIVLMIAVSVAPLLLISGIILYQFHVSYQEKVLAHLEEVVLKHGQNINSFLDEKLTAIRVMAKTFSPEHLKNESFLREKLAILQDEHGGVFQDLGLVSETGLQVAYAGAFKLGQVNYAEADWFKKALKSEYFISDVFLGVRGLPHFIVAVKKEWQESNWILRSTIDFVAFNTLVENLRIGKTGLAFIINRQGEFQTKTSGSTPLDSIRYSDLPEDWLAQQTTGTVREDYLRKITSPSGRRTPVTPITVIKKEPTVGQSFIYVMTPLKKGEWLLIYRQDEADALSDLQRAQKLAVVIFLLGTLGIVTVVFFLSKRFTEHIAIADKEKELLTEQIIEAGKLASVGELAAGIAHEINNPVAIMVEEAGWIGDILEDGNVCDEQEEVHRALNQIRSQGERCKQITHKLLSFARKTDPELRKVELTDLVKEVAALVEQRAKYSNVKIELNLAPSLPEVYSTPSEFEQVMLNLMNNSLDAMTPDGGTLTITTQVHENNVVIEVSDTGHGIPEANFCRIFDPFFTTKPQGKGTGLGLSICYGITKKMGGDISVESTVGVGTTFRVSFPIPTETGPKRQVLHATLERHLGRTEKHGES